MYTQDQDWPAVNECMMKIKSLASGKLLSENSNSMPVLQRVEWGLVNQKIHVRNERDCNSVYLGHKHALWAIANATRQSHLD